MIIDAIVLGIAQIPFSPFLSSYSQTVVREGSGYSYNYTSNPMLSFVSLVIAVVYFVFLQQKMGGQTLGKKALGIKVVDASGKVPSYVTLFLREIIGKLISAIIFGIGYLMVVWDSKKQGLHDKIASTFVIKV